jgi:hypothetical protein
VKRTAREKYKIKCLENASLCGNMYSYMMNCAINTVKNEFLVHNTYEFGSYITGKIKDQLVNAVLLAGALLRKLNDGAFCKIGRMTYA